MFVTCQKRGKSRYVYLQHQDNTRTYVGRKSLMFFGPANAGKTKNLKNVYKYASEIYGECVLIDAKKSISEWVGQIEYEEKLKLSEKREEFKQYTKGKCVFVDDIHLLSRQKLQFVKECLQNCKYFVISAKDLQSIPPTILAYIEDRKKKGMWAGGIYEINLKSDVAEDYTYAFIAVMIIILFIAGYRELSFMIMFMRYMSRQK